MAVKHCIELSYDSLRLLKAEKQASEAFRAVNLKRYMWEVYGVHLRVPTNPMERATASFGNNDKAMVFKMRFG